jgi:O-acetyl-ADP-ribose deacetylase (regulator of RNase III)
VFFEQASRLSLSRSAMTEITRHGVTLQLAQGDIAAQDDIEAVVNAANAQLVSGGGVAGALHRAAGPGLAEEGRPMAPIQPGEVVVTGAFGYPMEEAAEVALDTVREALPELKHVRLVRFVLYDQSALDVHERVLAEVFPEPY